MTQVATWRERGVLAHPALKILLMTPIRLLNTENAY